ncbi:hypothetical protein [Streptomyces sp. CS014]|uniref:hypothetical protein n=1 Tax=Streptomyces sp. CS014 TaxID=2162707 RepID=UPI000D5135B7|nr:hypothetical protein [Streptomyces sp. CS014]PVD04455.1 hypothetical protein DBP12_03250 [Streptomyces sp. CS014]
MHDQKLKDCKQITACCFCGGPAPQGSTIVGFNASSAVIEWRVCADCAELKGSPSVVTTLDACRALCTAEEYQLLVTAGPERVVHQAGVRVSQYRERSTATPFDAPHKRWEHADHSVLKVLDTAKRAIEQKRLDITPVPHPEGWPCRVCGANYALPALKEAVLNETPLTRAALFPSSDFQNKLRAAKYEPTQRWSVCQTYGNPVCGPCVSRARQVQKLWDDAGGKPFLPGLASYREHLIEFHAHAAWQVEEEPRAGIARLTCWRPAYRVRFYRTDEHWGGRYGPWAYIPPEVREAARAVVSAYSAHPTPLERASGASASYRASSERVTQGYHDAQRQVEEDRRSIPPVRTTPTEEQQAQTEAIERLVWQIKQWGEPVFVD